MQWPKNIITSYWLHLTVLKNNYHFSQKSSGWTRPLWWHHSCRDSSRGTGASHLLPLSGCSSQKASSFAPRSLVANGHSAGVRSNETEQNRQLLESFLWGTVIDFWWKTPTFVTVFLTVCVKAVFILRYSAEEDSSVTTFRFSSEAILSQYRGRVKSGKS